MANAKALSHSSSLVTTRALAPLPENINLKRKRDESSLVESSQGDDEEDEEECKEEVEKKIVELQKIVPGGESLENVDNLFEETAGYILDLQNQIKGLRVLASFFELLDKQKTKLGA
ncbi:Transcription factor PAR2 [Heracleum sosnowskyi]|uniref:Transcription factor PAR2 n=1 Tax=Heracleum sosnowskyi TaxID=360622 RepID=A0AAD8NEG6_9APIA|nr:Transcription factor PAR2 [Heracleum sosnowskyi]